MLAGGRGIAMSHDRAISTFVQACDWKISFVPSSLQSMIQGLGMFCLHGPVQKIGTLEDVEHSIEYHHLAASITHTHTHTPSAQLGAIPLQK